MCICTKHISSQSHHLCPFLLIIFLRIIFLIYAAIVIATAVTVPITVTVTITTVTVTVTITTVTAVIVVLQIKTMGWGRIVERI